jgi:rod shape determining protein RodA
MSQHLDDERSSAAVWWDSFANFAWRTDWTQVVILLFLSGLGIVAIQSAGSARESTFYRSQTIFVVIGWLAYWAISALDYRHIQRYARRIYLGCLVILIPVSLCALLHRDLGSFIRSINGARRWMDFGPFSIQPSEFAKIGVLVFIAAMLARSPIGSFRATWRTVFWCLGAAAVPFVLIFVQPDLGSALIYLPLSFILLFVAGLTFRFFLVAGAAALLLVGVVALDLREYAAKVDQYAKANPSAKDPVRAVRGEHEAEAWFFLLKDYQRERIMSFIAPEVIDPKGLGVTWNVNQAVIAVGRGGFRGQGIGNGTQARFGYLPEAAAHNDFLFSGMAEEIGFTGGLLVIGAFVLLFWRVVRTAARAADRFGSLLAIGAAVVLGTHVVINIGMNINLMPVTGVPLPFLSYGGSFVLSCFLLLGLVQSVHRHSAGGGEGGGSPATGLTA